MAFRIIHDDIANVTADSVVDASSSALVGESLALAKESGCESIAFALPVNKDDELSAAIDTFRSFLQTEEMEITLVVPESEAVSPGDEIFAGVEDYLNENYLEEFASPVFYREMASEAMGDFAPEEEACEEAEDADAAPVRSKETKKEKSKIRLNILPEFIGASAKCESTPMKAAAAEPMMASRSLSDLMMQVGETWQQSLFRLIDEKGFLDTEVYKRANVDRKLFSKIRSNPDYQPKKITAVAFALALGLSLDETKDFLGRAGYAFSPSSKFDLIVEYFIEHEVYDTYTINLALFDHDQPLLGE